MFSIDKIKKLTKQLFPTGRAFNYPIDGGLDKLMSSLAESEKRAIDDNYSILDQILPDNSNFSADDATKWENRLGMITVSGVSLSDRKESIKRKMNHPGTSPARQSHDYLQNGLQAAGFNVYVNENVSGSPVLGTVIQSGQIQSGQLQSGSMPYLFKVANSLDAEVDSNFIVSNNFRSVFIVGGSVLGTNADVQLLREKEFRQLILKLKPANTVAFLKINYI